MTDYDLVIVGGGIHGVGVAQAAAAHGHRALVLERSGLAEGTSSRSSKLIHGGLRYLEHGALGLVRECLRERALLLRNAPELVRLRWFHVPIYRATRRRPWQLHVGLGLYALLAGLARDARYRVLPRSAWDDLDGLVTDDLQAVFAYRDAQTDDARLTRAVMASAQGLGAELAAPARFVGARLDGDVCAVDYVEAGERPRSCTARVVVNAAGPWAPAVLASITPACAARPVDLVQGAHIIVRGAVERGIYYVESPADGRAVFVMPWEGDTLVGTTETPIDDPDDARVTEEERTSLANVLERHFPRYDPGAPGAIRGAFAGVRVLPAGTGRAFARSRETILDGDRRDRPRVLTIYGGKLTAYRATAEKVIRRLAAVLPPRRAVADTATLPLAPP